MSRAIVANATAVVCVALWLGGSLGAQSGPEGSAPAENAAAPPPQTAAAPEQDQGAVQQRGVAAPTRRVPGARVNAGAAVLGLVQSREGIPLGGVQVALQPIGAGKISSAETSADGIFRKRDLVPGKYQITFQLPGYEPLMQTGVALRSGEVLTIEVRLKSTGAPTTTAKTREVPVQPGTTEEGEMPSYREIMRRPAKDMDQAQFAQMEMPPESRIAVPEPDRWNIALPPWLRYPGRPGEYPYSGSHWWDPFNRNKLKGDYPILGQNTFFNFTGVSNTALDVRRLYIPSGVSGQNPFNERFFGKGGQAFVQETIRLTFDLFHGDTSFKPVDWRIRLTPAFNVNQLWVQEKGIVNIDVR